MSRRTSSSESESQIYTSSIKSTKQNECKENILVNSGNLGTRKNVRSFIETAIATLKEDRQFQQKNLTICTLVFDKNEKTVTVGDLSNNSKAYAIIAARSGKKILVSLSQNKDSAQTAQISSFTFDEIINALKKDSEFKDDKLEVESLLVASKGFCDKEGYFLKSQVNSPNLFDAIYRLQIGEDSRKIIRIRNNLENPSREKKLEKFEKLHDEYQSNFKDKSKIYQAQYLSVVANLFNGEHDSSIAQIDVTKEELDRRNPQLFLALAISDSKRSAEAATALVNDGFNLSQVRPSSQPSSTYGSPTRSGFAAYPIPE